MNIEDIAIAYSVNKAGDSATKEISRGIKSVTKAKPISLCLLFFTPHYNPSIVKEVLDITLRSKNTFAVQAPIVIFQNKVLKRGMVCCCISDSNLQIRSVFTEDNDALNTERLFRKNTANIIGGKRVLLSAISPKINVHRYLRGLELALGRNINTLSAGFIKKYGSNNFQVLNDAVGEGQSSIIAVGNIEANNEHIEGYIPLGRKFTITKAAPDENRIIEIDKKPAALIYKKYLGDKFSFFKRTDFCSFYPIGIKVKTGYKIIQVLDLLDDDSLLCLGNIENNSEANIMLSSPQYMMRTLEKSAMEIKHRYSDGIAIVFNSMLRRRILKSDADREINSLKYILGRSIKMIGLYSDYQIISGGYMQEFSIGSYYLSMMLLSNRRDK